MNVQPPITVEILTPVNDDSLSGTAQIAAKVTVLPGVTLDRVAFTVDNQEIASIPGDPTKTEYSADWVTGEARQYPVKVIAYDTAGLFTTETGIFVNVAPGGSGGVVVIIVLAFAALVIPLALRSRTRKGKARSAVAGRDGHSSSRPALFELEGLTPNQIWQLGASEVKLGRKGEENDVPLKGLNASRRHAVIRFEMGEYVIYTLNVRILPWSIICPSFKSARLWAVISSPR